METTRYDVIVIGARCAGASTAMLLAREGLHVLLVDRAPPGTETLSTHALMRGGVLQLHRWGLLPRISAVTPVIRSATFHYADEAIAVPIKPRDGMDGLYAPRRTVLDPVLVDAARAAGAEVAFGAAATELVRDRRGRVTGVMLARADGTHTAVAARIVVGADGLRSRVANLAGAAVEREGRHAAAFLYGHWPGLEMASHHWYFRPGVTAGAIPTNDGHTCVFVGMPRSRFAEELPRGAGALFDRVLGEADPGLARALRGAGLEAKLWPFAGTPGFARRAWGPGWALVGDAGMFRDPITAHGMTDALRDAELLARAIVEGTDASMAEYQRARDDAALGILELSDDIASFAWDLDRVKALHDRLTKEMAREVELLRALGEAPRHPVVPSVPVRPDAQSRRPGKDEKWSASARAAAAE
jgi:flavin-dependent dehydrogenase